MNLITAVLALLGLIGLDVLLGVIKAVAAGTFDPAKLPSFLGSTFPIEQTLGTVVLGVVQAVQTSGDTSSKGLAAAFLLAITALSAKVLKDIVSKLASSKA